MARTRLYPPSVDPGFPELPSTPDGWVRTTFGDVLEVAERPRKLDPNDSYRLLTAKRSRGGITLRGELHGRDILTKTQFEARAGDFLISRRQIIHGACGVVPAELDGAIVSNEYSTLRTRPTLLMEYLQHYTHTPYFQRTCFHSSHGVDVEKMIFKINEWLVREVDVPPLFEQRKIAAILSSLDEAIEARQAVIDQLQVVKKAMMVELLSRGLPGRHSRFKQMKNGNIPEEWEVVRALATVEKVPNHGSIQRQHYEQQGRFPIIDQGATFIAGFTDDQTLVIDEGCPVIVFGDHTREWKFVTMPFVPGADGTQLLRGIAGTDPKFLFFALSALELKSLGYSRHFKLLKEAWIALPPLEEQQQITGVLNSFEDRLLLEHAGVDALLSLKSALMAVLLSGEVRVKAGAEAP